MPVPNSPNILPGSSELPSQTHSAFRARFPEGYVIPKKSTVIQGPPTFPKGSSTKAPPVALPTLPDHETPNHVSKPSVAPTTSTSMVASEKIAPESNGNGENGESSMDPVPIPKDQIPCSFCSTMVKSADLVRHFKSGNEDGGCIRVYQGPTKSKSADTVQELGGFINRVPAIPGRNRLDYYGSFESLTSAHVLTKFAVMDMPVFVVPQSISRIMWGWASQSNPDSQEVSCSCNKHISHVAILEDINALSSDYRPANFAELLVKGGDKNWLPVNEWLCERFLGAKFVFWKLENLLSTDVPGDTVFVFLWMSRKTAIVFDPKGMSLPEKEKGERNRMVFAAIDRLLKFLTKRFHSNCYLDTVQKWDKFVQKPLTRYVYESIFLEKPVKRLAQAYDSRIFELLVLAFYHRCTVQDPTIYVDGPQDQVPQLFLKAAQDVGMLLQHAQWNEQGSVTNASFWKSLITWAMTNSVYEGLCQGTGPFASGAKGPAPPTVGFRPTQGFSDSFLHGCREVRMTTETDFHVPNSSAARRIRGRPSGTPNRSRSRPCTDYTARISVSTKRGKPESSSVVRTSKRIQEDAVQQIEKVYDSLTDSTPRTRRTESPTSSTLPAVEFPAFVVATTTKRRKRNQNGNGSPSTSVPVECGTSSSNESEFSSRNSTGPAGTPVFVKEPSEKHSFSQPESADSEDHQPTESLRKQKQTPKKMIASDFRTTNAVLATPKCKASVKRPRAKSAVPDEGLPEPLETVPVYRSESVAPTNPPKDENESAVPAKAVKTPSVKRAKPKIKRGRKTNLSMTKRRKSASASPAKSVKRAAPVKRALSVKRDSSVTQPEQAEVKKPKSAKKLSLKAKRAAAAAEVRHAEIVIQVHTCVVDDSCCGFTSEILETTKDHVREHLDRCPYQCYHCHRWFSCLRALQMHTELIGIELLKCVRCEYKSNDPAIMHRHVQDTHLDVPKCLFEELMSCLKVYHPSRDVDLWEKCISSRVK